MSPTASPAVVSLAPPSTVMPSMPGTPAASPAPTPTAVPTPVPTATVIAVPAGVAMPSPSLTPGETFPSVTAAQVCRSGYASSVRHVEASQYHEVYAEYGIAYPEPSGTYELDHLIPLELGGDNANANLWPEPASPTPGFHQKDDLENVMHGLVCSGRLDLHEAQVPWHGRSRRRSNASASSSAAPSERVPKLSRVTGDRHEGEAVVIGHESDMVPWHASRATGRGMGRPAGG